MIRLTVTTICGNVKQDVAHYDRESKTVNSSYPHSVNHMLSVTLQLKTANFNPLPTYSVLTHACPMLSTEKKKTRERA